MSWLRYLLDVVRNKSRRTERIRNASLLRFLYGTGLKTSELCALTLEDVHYQEGKPVALTIEREKLSLKKRQKSRTLPLSPTAKEALQEWLDYRKKKARKLKNSPYLWVVLSRTGKKAVGAPLDPQGVRAMLTRYTQLAKLDLAVTPSRLRYTFAYELEEAEVEMRVINALLGRKQPGEAPSPTELQQAVALLPDPLAPAPK